MQITKLLITDMSDGDTIKKVNYIVDSFYTVFKVTCYSDVEGTIPVSALSGTAYITVADDDFNYGSIQSEAEVEGLVDLTLPDYNRPSLNGFMQSYKVTLANVTGCLSLRVVAITEVY